MADVRPVRPWVLGMVLGTAIAVFPLLAQESNLPPATIDDVPLEEIEAPPAPPEPSPVPVRTAPLVRRVEVRSDAPIEDRDDLAELLVVVPGERLTDRAVRQTLRNLQTAGTAYEAELYTRAVGPPDATPGEVDVVLALWAAVQIEAVAFEGELGLGRRDLERRLDLAVGEPLSDSALLRGVYELYDLYRERGYFGATVRLDPEIDTDRKRARVIYRVQSGERARISGVRFEGDRGPFESANLAEKAGVETGDAYRQSRIAESAEELQAWLIDQGYRTAEVESPEEEVSEGGRAVSLVYPLELGPKVEVRVIGAKQRRLERRGLLPFLDESYDEALLLQAVDRIRTDYQERGHWQVEVEGRQERVTAPDGTETLVVTIEIVEGPEYTVESLEFVGNEVIGDDELDELVETSPRRLLALGSGRLVDSVLQEDIENLEAYYALEGFLGTEIGPVDLAVSGQSIALEIPIVEGRRRQVVNLDLVGLDSLDVDSFRDELTLAEGGPYHPARLDQTLAELRGRYEALGFASAQVSARLDWNPDETLVDVTIRAIEGPQVTVDRVIVRGNVKTKDEVIENAISLEPGEPVSRTRLLEVERDLYRLGIFARVEAELAPAELAEESRDVLVRVEEGRTRRVTYGISYDYDPDGSEDGLGGLLGYSQSNLFGRAFTLQLDAVYNQREELGRFIVDQPRVTRWNIPIIYSLLYSRESRDNPDYDVTRYAAGVEAFRQIDQWRYGLAVDYRRVELDLLDDVDPVLAEIDREDQNIQISSLVPNILVDERDDPLNPTEGWSGSFRLQYAFPIEGLTQANFLKPFFQATGYFRLGRELERGVIAASLRLGSIQPLSDETPGGRPLTEGEPDLLAVPIDERFFVGGNFSHRAYGRDELGILGSTVLRRDDASPDDVAPRGGNGLVLLNLDYRFPIWGSFQGVVFADTGNVWAEWDAVDLGELSTGVGAGVRWVSPIGVLRGGVAYQLDPYPGVESSGRYRFYIALGNPF